ncbi:hypothetical protein SBRCBS47491_002730 [Sporothrix bragantina]|uniref:Uncharacterized protein n=1 Tax=Sporothrix bragantina TaxID=671064 RepID=A0ABP0B962_9PEZI
MPSVAQEAPEGDIRNDGNTFNGLSILSKKRRWEDSSRGSATSNDSNDVVTIFVHGGERVQNNTITPTSTYSLNSTVSPSQRKVLPLGSKRLCLSNTSGNTDSWPASLSTSPSKLVRESGMHHHNSPTHSITAPCHICHRKPRRKCDLDSLAYCEGCGERTCFVCLRECLGWTDNEAPEDTAATPTAEATEEQQPWSTTSHGHRRTVCSRCCVERGEDGDVVCLGCISVIGE